MFQEMTNIFRKNQTQDSDIHRSQEFILFHYDKNLKSKTN